MDATFQWGGQDMGSELLSVFPLGEVPCLSGSKPSPPSRCSILRGWAWGWGSWDNAQAGDEMDWRGPCAEDD